MSTPTISQIELNNLTFDLKDPNIQLIREPQVCIRYDYNNPSNTGYGFVDNITAVANKAKEYGYLGTASNSVKALTGFMLDHSYLIIANHEIHFYTIDLSFVLNNDISANTGFAPFNWKKWNAKDYVQGASGVDPVDWNERKKWLVFPKVNMGMSSVAKHLHAEWGVLYYPNSNKNSRIDAQTNGILPQTTTENGQTSYNSYPLKANWVSVVPLEQRTANYYWKVEDEDENNV